MAGNPLRADKAFLQHFTQCTNRLAQQTNMSITTQLNPNKLYPNGKGAKELLNGWNIDEAPVKS
jgi:hypothetical protein